MQKNTKKIKSVSEIDPIFKHEDRQLKKLRVAAYVRVATNSGDKENSLKSQKKHYATTISENPNWEYAGLYADDGIRITSTRNRPEFNRMIEDCKAGKIDLVVVKDVSRIAKNIVDCLNIVETLQALDPPVGIYFEYNNLNTHNVGANFFLTVLAMVAELEREFRSQSVKEGLRRKGEKNGKKP